MGSNFYFKIPVEILHNQEGVKPNDTRYDLFNWQNKKVLIVEDDTMSFKLLSSVLKDTNVTILIAKNGLDAIKLVNENNIDLVLMDIQLPDLNGFEATKKIKSIKKDLPIIAVSAYAMQAEIDKSKEVGCDEFISKPININQLLNSINQYIY